MRSTIIRTTLFLLIFSFQIYPLVAETLGSTPGNGTAIAGPIKEIATGGRLISTTWAPLDESYWFASRDKYLYRYHPGEDPRRARLEDRPLSNIVEGPDGKLYLFLENRALQAVSPGGIAAWSYNLESSPIGEPVIGPEGTIFITSQGRRLIALSPAGTLRWELSLPAEAVTNPLLFMSKQGLALAVPCESGRSYAYLLDGSRLWQFLSADTAVAPLAGESPVYLPTPSGIETGG